MFDFFDTPSKQRILFFLCKHPEEEFTVNGLHDELKIPVATVSVTLEQLKKVIESRYEGKFKYVNMKEYIAQDFEEVFDLLEKLEK